MFYWIYIDPALLWIGGILLVALVWSEFVHQWTRVHQRAVHRRICERRLGEIVGGTNAKI